jgi:hypothetical protein
MIVSSSDRFGRLDSFGASLRIIGTWSDGVFTSLFSSGVGTMKTFRASRWIISPSPGTVLMSNRFWASLLMILSLFDGAMLNLFGESRWNIGSSLSSGLVV